MKQRNKENKKLKKKLSRIFSAYNNSDRLLNRFSFFNLMEIYFEIVMKQ